MVCLFLPLMPVLELVFLDMVRLMLFLILLQLLPVLQLLLLLPALRVVPAALLLKNFLSHIDRVFQPHLLKIKQN
jgi:hypothetical protein